MGKLYTISNIMITIAVKKSITKNLQKNGKPCAGNICDVNAGYPAVIKFAEKSGGPATHTDDIQPSEGWTRICKLSGLD